MMTVKMKKIRLIIVREDLQRVLTELIRLGCVEVTDPEDLLENPLMNSLVEREIVNLDSYNANLDSIALLGTHSTMLLAGWLPARSEPELAAQLSKYLCAWEILSPSFEEQEKIPVKLRLPKLFGLLYRGEGKPFNPIRGQMVEDEGQGIV